MNAFKHLRKIRLANVIANIRRACHVNNTTNTGWVCSNQNVVNNFTRHIYSNVLASVTRTARLIFASIQLSFKEVENKNLTVSIH